MMTIRQLPVIGNHDRTVVKLLHMPDAKLLVHLIAANDSLPEMGSVGRE